MPEYKQYYYEPPKKEEEKEDYGDEDLDGNEETPNFNTYADGYEGEDKISAKG